MSFNEIVDVLNRQGHNFSFTQVPADVFATLFPGAAEIAAMFSYFQAHTYLGSDWSDLIALANKIAGKQTDQVFDVGSTECPGPERLNATIHSMRIEIMETLLDHVFLTVKELDRSIAFYETALKPLGIVHAIDYDGKDGPEGHPDLKGFGRDGRVFFWLRQGDADAKAAHIGFVAESEAKVNAFYAAAMAAGATDNGKPGARPYYDPRYYAANVSDPDGYSLEAVYKSWQHRQS